MKSGVAQLPIWTHQIKIILGSTALLTTDPTLTPVTPLTHLYPPDPPNRPKHAPKRNPMANPDPTESSHTPRGSIAPMGHQGGALGHGYGELHCCEHPFGLHRHAVPRAAFSDHMREQGRFHPNPSIRSRLRHP